MAILKVAQMGHPVLRMLAQTVEPEVILTPGFQQFLQDMLDTMDEYDGAGLAAPQVHHAIRVVCLTLMSGRDPEFWINPTIHPLTDKTIKTYEGCLSVAGVRAAVDRYADIHVSFLDVYGNSREYRLTGFPAVVAQHECDHLNGILYTDRCDPLTMAFVTEFRRWGPLDEEETPEAEPPEHYPNRIPRDSVPDEVQELNTPAEA